MKTKNALSILLGITLLIGSGFMVAGTTSNKDDQKENKRVKVTIIKDNSGTLNKTEETIEVSGREDIKTYLKKQDVDLSTLNIYAGRKHKRADLWVYNTSGKHMHHGNRMMIIESDEQLDQVDGEKTEKVIVKTMVIEEEENSGKTEKQEIKIKKQVDEDGNVTIQKWVNGEEVDPDTKIQHHKIRLNETNDEVLVEMQGENGKASKTIKIKKEVDKDGNVTVMKSVNGGEFKKIEYGGDNAYCMKRRMHREHGNLGFAARSEDGSTMVFVTPVEENNSKRSNTKVEQAENNLDVQDVSFYPNPAEGQFSIAFTSSEQGQIQVKVMDMQGKEVLNKEFDHSGGQFKQEIELNDAQPGMYLFTITQNGKAYNHKLMVK